MRSKSKGISIIAICALATACVSMREGWRSATATTNLRRLDVWRQLPPMLLEECNKVDPAGSQARAAAYQEWLVKNTDELAKLQTIFSPAAERLYPELRAQGLDPAQYQFVTNTSFISKFLAELPPSEKAEKCLSYATTLDDPPVTPIQRAEYFSYLNDLVAHN